MRILEVPTTILNRGLIKIKTYDTDKELGQAR